jgi:diguanylate cyclase (GGDEF)-like protein
MHPAIPGLARWAWAGGFAALALVLILSHGVVAWLPSLSLAQASVVTGLVLAWDGFRRFLGRKPLSRTALAVLTALVLGWIVATQLGQPIEVRAVGNAVLMALLSTLIAHELFRSPRPLPLAVRITAWAYAANATFFFIRAVAASQTGVEAGPLNPDGFAPFMLLWWLGMTVAITLGMVLMAAERLQSDLDSQANRDPLTGALNRRAFALLADKELARARRHGTPLSVLLVDLDEFKQVNDQLGHDAGDTLLCRFVSIAGDILRGEDIFCRFGGEEFVALLPNTPSEQALIVAERLRIAYAQGSATIKTLRGAGPTPITVSIGIGELERDEDIDGLLRRADAALYRAKDAGRNRCERAEVMAENKRMDDERQQAPQPKP